MSPTSYLTAPPRNRDVKLTEACSLVNLFSKDETCCLPVSTLLEYNHCH